MTLEILIFLIVRTLGLLFITVEIRKMTVPCSFYLSSGCSQASDPTVVLLLPWESLVYWSMRRREQEWGTRFRQLMDQESPPGDDFSKSVQIYSRVYGIYRVGKPGDKP